jgi:hypothetical protein
MRGKKGSLGASDVPEFHAMCTDVANCHYMLLCCYFVLQAPTISMRGKNHEVQRFCFQCGKLEPISMFNGAKR